MWRGRWRHSDTRMSQLRRHGAALRCKSLENFYTEVVVFPCDDLPSSTVCPHPSVRPSVRSPPAGDKSPFPLPPSHFPRHSHSPSLQGSGVLLDSYGSISPSPAAINHSPALRRHWCGLPPACSPHLNNNIAARQTVTAPFWEQAGETAEGYYYFYLLIERFSTAAG